MDLVVFVEGLEPSTHALWGWIQVLNLPRPKRYPTKGVTLPTELHEQIVRVHNRNDMVAAAVFAFRRGFLLLLFVNIFSSIGRCQSMAIWTK